VKPVLKLMEQVPVKGLAHITGGGLTENIPRVLPQGTCARLERSRWPALRSSTGCSATAGLKTAK
jgi:phosphoribosylformylglycinamidine cyclo-ligase